MLNKAKICVASVGFRIFVKLKTNATTADVLTSPSPNSFYESGCESKSHRHESKSQRHESKSESLKSGLESGLGLESSQLCRCSSS